MELTKKLLTNLLKIMKINGFHIIACGENPVTFNIEGSFYFDNNEELEAFRLKIKELFASHCGGEITVETFEERALIQASKR
jgi:hypothetical protein